MKRLNLAGWLLVLVVACVVEGLVRLAHVEASVATPSSTVRALAEELGSGSLAGELGATLESYVEGLAIAVALGVVLGVAIGGSRLVRDGSSVLVEFLRPIPAVAVIPLAIMVFGLGLPLRRFVVAYAVLWPVLINTAYGIRGTDRLLDDVARTSGVGRVGRLVRVRLPAALPSVATGVRVAATAALLVAVTAEFVTGSAGVGAYMRRQQLAFHLPELYAAIVLTALLGYAVNVGLRAAERRVVFWAGEERLEPR